MVTPSLRLGFAAGRPASSGSIVSGAMNPQPIFQPRREPTSPPKRVLIVEDNELNMKLFHDLLEAHGYETLQTKDGMEALRLARHHRPNLILMDIQLPEVSGLEVTKWIKEDDELRSIPVIAVTAFAMKGDEEKIREGGCEAYIAKPISVANFLQTVERFVT
jgi:two-component system cell cycle response regulator DivK